MDNDKDERLRNLCVAFVNAMSSEGISVGMVMTDLSNQPEMRTKIFGNTCLICVARLYVECVEPYHNIVTDSLVNFCFSESPHESKSTRLN